MDLRIEDLMVAVEPATGIYANEPCPLDSCAPEKATLGERCRQESCPPVGPTRGDHCRLESCLPGALTKDDDGCRQHSCGRRTKKPNSPDEAVTLEHGSGFDLAAHRAELARRLMELGADA